MKRVVFLLLTFGLLATAAVADCSTIALELKLPVKLKTKGKPKVARYDKVDQTLYSLTRSLQGSVCEFSFSRLFKMKDEEVFFPLTNSVIRLAPEGTFKGLEVFTKDGDELGEYEGRVKYERSGGLYAPGRKSYSLFYFQFRSKAGRLESVGQRLLLDNFVVKWADIKDKVAVSTISD